MTSVSQRKTVVVTGANGYIGLAVAKAFVQAGYNTYGLIRRDSDKAALERLEIIPIVGSPKDVKDWSDRIKGGSPHVIVSTSEDVTNYNGHYEEKLLMLQVLSSLGQRKPLVLFTSGCKDYGRTGYDGDSDLHASTEGDDLRPPPFLADRCRLALKVFEHSDKFDAVVLRPTTLYGYSSSYYGSAFERAELARSKGSALIIPSRPESIMHGCHIDDCANAYVCLAEHPNRKELHGQAFNISASTYETAGAIATKLAKEYGIADIIYRPEEGTEDTKIENILFAFSQQVSSEKLRRLIGWKDVRPSFQDNIAVYRKSYEAHRMV